MPCAAPLGNEHDKRQAGAFGTITTTGAKKLDNGNFLANLTATGNMPKNSAMSSLTVAGNLGTQQLTFAGSSTLSSIANAVNNITQTTASSAAIMGFVLGFQVSDRYPDAFPFAGTLIQVDIQLLTQAQADAAATASDERASMGRQ